MHLAPNVNDALYACMHAAMFYARINTYTRAGLLACMHAIAIVLGIGGKLLLNTSALFLRCIEKVMAVQYIERNLNS